MVQLKHSLHVTEHRTSLSRNNTIHKGTQTEGEEGREDGELRDKEAEIALLKDKLLAIQVTHNIISCIVTLCTVAEEGC